MLEQPCIVVNSRFETSGDTFDLICKNRQVGSPIVLYSHCTAAIVLLLLGSVQLSRVREHMTLHCAQLPIKCATFRSALVRTESLQSKASRLVRDIMERRRLKEYTVMW